MSQHRRAPSGEESDFPQGVAYDQFLSFITLLQTWARLYDRHDYWPEACEQWASHMRSSIALQQAMPLLDKLFLYSNEKEDSVYSNIQRNRRLFPEGAALSVFTNKDGRILSIGAEAEKQLGLSATQFLEQALIEPIDRLHDAAAMEPRNHILTEIRGKDGIQRLCGVKFLGDVLQNGAELVFTLQSIYLPAATEKYLRQKLRLTDAEIDIVRRSIRRQDLETIAERRSNTINTVRTHISKITKKFGCRNFTDVITRTHELIAYNETYQSFSIDLLPDEAPSTRRITSTVKVSSKGGELEYSRYGPVGGKPLVLLHSLEYGFIPPPTFIQAAHRAGYVVYSPLRPGFGKSTPAHAIHDCAAALNQYFDQLKLRDVTIIAFSTAAPTALILTEISERISNTVLVNYALDAAEKLKQIKPKWLKGLLDLGLNSRQSFKFCMRMTNRMYRRFGYERFYQQLYKGCEEDLQYLEDNPSDLEYAANILFAAHEDSVRLDLMSSFDPGFPMNWSSKRKSSILCVHGQNTHGVSVEPARGCAEKHGFPFVVVKNSGRNCAFQAPEEFFSAIDQQHHRLKSA